MFKDAIPFPFLTTSEWNSTPKPVGPPSGQMTSVHVSSRTMTAVGVLASTHSVNLDPDYGRIELFLATRNIDTSFGNWLMVFKTSIVFFSSKIIKHLMN